MIEHEPSAAIAAAIIERQLGRVAFAIERFPTGLKNWVYAARLDDGREVVARMNRPGQGAHFAAAVRWRRRLAPLGVPLPMILAYDAQPPDSGYPFMIIVRLPGQDLGEVYSALTTAQKQALAGEIVAIQRAVGTLPAGSGYGYASGYDDPGLHPTWVALLHADLARSRARIAAAGIVDPAIVDRVERRFAAHATYLARVPPLPFLDDTTTKNVLIADGRLTGIVDVDCVCFGDPLFTVALTRMALLSRAYPTDYIEAWCDHLELSAAQQAALDLYTALFCAGFLSEFGQQHNRASPLPAEDRQIARLLAIWHDLATTI